MPCAEPESAIEAVRRIRHTILLVVSGKGRNDGDHLVVGQSFLKGKLIVTEAGIVFSDFHDAMQNKLPVFSLIQRQVIAPEAFAFGQGRKHHAVPALLEHGEHTRAAGIDAHRASLGQLCADEGHHFLQGDGKRCALADALPFGIMRGIHCLQGYRQRL